MADKWPPEITYPRTFSQMQNPITRAIVQLDPAFIAETKAHEDKFVKHLYAYLAAGWDLRLASPETLSPVGGIWRIPVPGLNSKSKPGWEFAGSSRRRTLAARRLGRPLTVGCAQCGDCCENIILNSPDLSRWTTEALKGVPDPATDGGWAHWREHGWQDEHRDTAIRRYKPDGRFRADADFITASWRETDNERWSCGLLDPVTRLCTAHDTRPPVCRDYPWYGREPSADSAQKLGGQCSYLADLPPDQRPEGSRPLIPLMVLTH